MPTNSVGRHTDKVMMLTDLGRRHTNKVGMPTN